jgi:hypothetical protein
MHDPQLGFLNRGLNHEVVFDPQGNFLAPLIDSE